MSLTLSNIKTEGGRLTRGGMLDKSDPYVHFYIDTPGWGGVKQETSHKNNDMEPNWEGEDIVLDELGDEPTGLTMKVSVYDDDFGKDDLIGEATVEFAKLKSAGGRLNLKVDNHLLLKDVYLSLDYVTSGWGTEGTEDNSIVLKNIRIEEGNLAKAGAIDTADAYVSVYINTPGWGAAKAQTTVKDNELQPNWEDESLTLEGLGDAPSTLEMVVTVYDSDYGKDDNLGRVTVDLSTLEQGGGELRLKIDENLIADDVFLVMEYETSGWGN